MSEERRSIELSNVNKWRSIYRTLLIALGVLIIAAQAAGLVLLIVRQDTNTGKSDRTLSILQGVQATNRFIINCTTPGHKCYEDSHHNTASTIQQLDEVIVLANFCAGVPGNNTLAKVRACVEKGLH